MDRIVSAIIAACTLVAVSAGMAQAQDHVRKVRCTVSAGAMGGHRFASLKCKDVDPNGRPLGPSVQWERDDKEAYRKLARLSGRRFTCEIGGTEGITMSGDMRTTHLKLKNCR